MSYLFVGYVVALLISLFVASWQIAIWALSIESLISGLILFRDEGIETWSARIQLIDLVLVRAVIIPVFLIGVLKKHKTPRNFDTVPANFVIWIFAAVLFIASYWFGQVVFPADFPNAGHLGTAVSGVLTGLFVLSNQKQAHGQIIGLLTLEAGIVLAEILTRHHERWEIQLGLSIVFIWTIVLFSLFLARFSESKEKRTEGAIPLNLEEKDVL